jgi:hypothetical protein
MTSVPMIRKTAAWILLTILTASAGLADAVTEYDLKAAYLLNFASYVEWPEPSAPVTICVYGDNPFKTTTIATLLEAKAGQINADFKYPRQAEQLTGCNILYLSLSERENFGKVSTLLRNAPVLIVSDVEGDLPPGVMINLITESNRLRFEINISAVLASKLKISSKMLKLAKIVP